LHSLASKSNAFLAQWLEQKLDDQKAFVLFRPPGAPNLTCLTETETKSDSGQLSFVFAPFDLEAAALRLVDPDGFTVSISELTLPQPFTPASLREGIEVKENYIQRIHKVREAINRGEVSKVVLSRTISLSVARDPWSIFVRLLITQENAYCYWWFHPDSGHWIGATPEVLMETVEDKVQVMSLAGTLAAESVDDAAWTAKEREEQAMVTDYIEEILKNFGDPVRIVGPTTVQAGNMIHLRTLLETKIQGDIKALVHQLHPTPAVCGLPVDKARRLIAKLEPHDRAFYTGYLGLQSGNPARVAQLYVNLRCMKWTPAEISVFVGGGITADSDPETEWQETLTKSSTLLDALDITRV